VATSKSARPPRPAYPPDRSGTTLLVRSSGTYAGPDTRLEPPRCPGFQTTIAWRQTCEFANLLFAVVEAHVEAARYHE
jgi:hypothetical protein